MKKIKIFKFILILTIFIFIPSVLYSIEIKITLNNALNNVDKLKLIIELKYNPFVEEINYNKSDIKKDTILDIKNYVRSYKGKKQAKYDIETAQNIEYSIIKEEDFVTEKIIYTFQVFEITDLYIIPLKISYKTGNLEKTIYTNPIPVLSKDIDIIKNELGQDILKSIKGPFYSDTMNPIFISVIVLLVIVIIILFFIIIKNRLSKQEKIVIESPYDDALKELDLLRDAYYPIKVFYMKLSEIIKRFLSKELNLYIMESTTTKTKNLLEMQNINNSLIKDIINLLDDCDYVKFAKHNPKISEMKEDLNRAYNIVYDYKKMIDFNKIEEENVKV